jgi:hypothetical protein
MAKDKYTDISIILNSAQAEFILESLNTLPDSEKRNINMQKLQKQIEKIVTVWRRRVKNDKIAEKARVARIKAKPDANVQ